MFCENAGEAQRFGELLDQDAPGTKEKLKIHIGYLHRGFVFEVGGITPQALTQDPFYLKAVAELAKAENIITICDNSYCTPLYQKPISLGIDMVLQSATTAPGLIP